jgi:hypothetical protein
MAIEKLLEEALAVNSRLAAALLRSLEPDDGDKLSEEEWPQGADA